MIDPFVPKAIGDQAIVTLKPICAYQAAALHFPDREFEECLSFHNPHDLDPYLPSSFENAEDRYLSCSTSPSYSFSQASKIRFVEFHLSFLGGFILSSAQDRRTKQVMQTIRLDVRQTEMTGSFPDRQIQFKELDRQ